MSSRRDASVGITNENTAAGVYHARVFQIVVFPPEETRAAVEPFRRLHDPAFHRVSPHVTLVPPFEEADARALRGRLAAQRSVAPATLTFAEPRVLGRALCVPVDDGDGRLAAFLRGLRDSVLPLSARLQENDDVPSLRVGLLGTDAELELARRSFVATAVRLAPFAPESLVLLMDDVRGLWHEVQSVPWPGRP